MIQIFLMFGSVILTGLFIPGSAVGKTESSTPLSTVEQVDLKRYVGLWYEIAKIPNSFQRKCARGTTAHYTLRKDGRIDVLNRCVKKDGKATEAKGIARIVDTKSDAKLKVSFLNFLGISLFWGDYWIIGLGKDYEYAIVGNPTRKYGWILSRSPSLSQEKLEQVFSQLRDKGYDPRDFEMTSQ